MTPLGRRQFAGGCLACTALALAGCVSDGTAPAPLTPGYQPAKTTDEADLWRSLDRLEGDIKRSRFLVTDPAVNSYVRDVACRLATDFCPDMRIYVMRTPLFNATMAPNGMMQVFSGLLLRARNEAQLAAVLGHEMGHYLHRHTLQQMRNVRATADFTAFLRIGLAVAGVGAVGDLVQLAALASIYSFSRDQEREADAVGFDLMTKAGYAPSEASKIWEQLIAESEADERAASQRGDIFFATHPAPEERFETLKAKAVKIANPSHATYQDRFRAQLRSIRRMLFQDELRLRQYARTLKLFEMLHAEGQVDGELAFFTGEVYRLRNTEGDLGKALIAYEQALAAGDAPPETHRGIGVVQMRLGDRVAADNAFRHYLDLNPTADDAAIIRSYMQVQS